MSHHSDLRVLESVKLEYSQNELNDIDVHEPDFFDNQSGIDFHIQSIFDEEKQFDSFIETLGDRFMGSMKENCEDLFERLKHNFITNDCISLLEEKLQKNPYLQVDSNGCKVPSSIFDLGLLKQKNYRRFIENFQSCYVDFQNQLFKNIVSSFFTTLTGTKEKKVKIKVSMSQKSTKKVPWSKKEENELLNLMQKNYPDNLTNQEIMKFCTIHNRTKSAVTNKCQKLKKKYNGEFLKKSEEIINGCLIDNSFTGDMSNMILNSLKIKGNRTYEELLVDLQIQTYDSNSIENVNRVLYDLLNKQNIRFNEETYVVLKEITGTKASDSVLINKIVEFVIGHPNKQISYELVKNGLIQHFKQIDPYKKNFDNELKQFMENSGFFSFQQKRVFYI